MVAGLTETSFTDPCRSQVVKPFKSTLVAKDRAIRKVPRAGPVARVDGMVGAKERAGPSPTMVAAEAVQPTCVGVSVSPRHHVAFLIGSSSPQGEGGPAMLRGAATQEPVVPPLLALVQTEPAGLLDQAAR